MTNIPQGGSDKYRQALFLAAFIGLAVWGGWGLARMGEDRATQKAEAESAVLKGSGEVTPTPEKSGSFETKPVSKPESEKPLVPQEVAKVPPVGNIRPVTEITEVKAPERLGPGVLRVRTVPLAEVWVTDAAGARPVGLANVAGEFSLSPPPSGEFRVEVRHADYLPTTGEPVKPIAAGEAVERLIVPEPRPASLVLLTDEGVTAWLDGRKVGGYMVMLGNLPSKRALALRLVGADGRTREESLTLKPRENRMVDRRTPAPAKPEPWSAVELARERLKEAPVAVKIVSTTPESGLVALIAATGKAAPLAEGKVGEFRSGEAGVVLKLKCERVFSGVSVCRVEKIPEGLVPPVTGELSR